jgi:hypothetical protein
MESLTRLVTESLVRHGFDRPLDYRRLRWSRWFRCESHHSLLLVPSKPGVFALAEEIMGLDTNHVGTDAFVRPTERSSAVPVEERRFSAASSEQNKAAALAAEGASESPKRMLAVNEFFEADDMAFVLDRMLARPNPMRDALNSGRYFIRFVIIEDESQRHSVCNSLNQWVASQSMANQSMMDSAEKTSGIASHFASSLELTPATEYIPAAQASLFENSGVGRTLMSANAGISKNPNHAGEINTQTSIAAQHLDAGAATNIHCPSPFPSGF